MLLYNGSSYQCQLSLTTSWPVRIFRSSRCQYLVTPCQHSIITVWKCVETLHDAYYLKALIHGLLLFCNYVLIEAMEGIPSVHKSILQASSQAGKLLHPLTYDFKKLQVSGLKEKFLFNVRPQGTISCTISTVCKRNSDGCAGFHQSADYNGDGHHPGSFSQGKVCSL